jgi:hypothetical protein
VTFINPKKTLFALLNEKENGNGGSEAVSSGFFGSLW